MTTALPVICVVLGVAFLPALLIVLENDGELLIRRRSYLWWALVIIGAPWIPVFRAVGRAVVWANNHGPRADGGRDR